MSDAFDDRRRGLEEEYFHKKNQEAIAKLREKIKVSNDAKAASSSELKCPRCGNELREHSVATVTTNACSRCGGIWLDSGELERLVEKEEGIEK